MKKTLTGKEKMWLRALCMCAAIPVNCVAASAYAQKLPVTIPGTTMPWNYTAKLNHNRDYGENNGTAPVVVTLADLGRLARPNPAHKICQRNHLSRWLPVRGCERLFRVYYRP